MSGKSYRGMGMRIGGKSVKYMVLSLFVVILVVSHLTISKADETKYFTTLEKVKIYSALQGKLQVLGHLKKNETFRILKEHSNHFEMAFGNSVGFVEKKYVKGSSIDNYLYHSLPSKNQGLIIIKTQAPIYFDTNSSSHRIGELNRDTSLAFEEKTGDFYKILLGGRLGYIDAKNASLPFDQQTKFFSVVDSNTPFYYKMNGKYKKAGYLIKGQQYVRTGELDGYHVVQIGDKKGYVGKKGTYRDEKALFANGSINGKNLGVIELNKNAKVFDLSTSKPIAFAEFQKGDRLPFIKLHKSYYGVNVFGRLGYIENSNIIDLYAPIKISFVGDMMMDWSVKTAMKKKGVIFPFQYVAPELKKSHLTVANLETAITTRNSPYPKTYNFKSDPTSISGLKNAGIDLVSLANNHAMDYKKEGLSDTMHYLKKANMPFVGAGSNATDANKPYVKIINGKKIKFMAFSRVLPDASWKAGSKSAGIADGYNLEDMLSRIKKEKKDSEFLFVYIHWGKEKSEKPESYQRTWAKKMIDAGADGIIGSHPHVLQGFEYYKGKPIAYSLGNFLFPDYVKGNTAQTGILHLEIKYKTVNMGFSPYYIYKNQIIAQDAHTKRKVWSKLQGISYGVKINSGNIIVK